MVSAVYIALRSITNFIVKRLTREHKIHNYMSFGHLFICILISDLVVTDLFTHSLPGMILLHLAMAFYIEGAVA